MEDYLVITSVHLKVGLIILIAVICTEYLQGTHELLYKYLLSLSKF
jgi:hypothetical protein